MHVTFWHSDKPRERILAAAFAEGVKAHGDDFETRALRPEIEVADCDVAIMVGVKSRGLFRAHHAAGAHVIYMDKGYTRHAGKGPVKTWEYWRVAVDAHQPTAYFMRENRPADRWERLGLSFLPWRRSEPGDYILLAGSSQKYHDFYGLSDPTKYASKIVYHLSQISRRPIIYRPKPSWKEALPVPGAAFSRGNEQIGDLLPRTAILVTHGSNACFDAALAGVPSICLGPAVAVPISSTSFDDILAPRESSESERLQWAANLAYCQWTQPEMASGEMWRYVRAELYR